MRKGTSFGIALCAVAMLSVGTAWGINGLTEVFEDFATAPASWVEQNSANPDGSFANFGFSDTGNATGNAGEAGGNFARVGAVSYYGTEFGHQAISLDDDLVIRATINMQDNVVNGQGTEVRIGYFGRDEIHACCDPLFTYLGVAFDLTGIQIFDYDEVSGRAFTKAGNIELNTPSTFDFSYNATTGIASLILDGGEAVEHTVRNRGSGRTFDTFGITPVGDGVFADFRHGSAFFDDITYNIPEPASLGLLTAGLLMMRRRR